MSTTAKIWLVEDFINETKGYRFGHSRPYETDYTHAEIGKLYRALRDEYGRCVSKVYITTRTEDGVPVGWVFKKRMEYEDARPDQGEERFYTREVWCCLYAQQPVPGVSPQNQPLRIDTGMPAFAYQLKEAGNA